MMRILEDEEGDMEEDEESRALADAALLEAAVLCEAGATGHCEEFRADSTVRVVPCRQR